MFARAFEYIRCLSQCFFAFLSFLRVKKSFVFVKVCHFRRAAERPQKIDNMETPKKCKKKQRSEEKLVMPLCYPSNCATYASPELGWSITHPFSLWNPRKKAKFNEWKVISSDQNLLKLGYFFPRGKCVAKIFPHVGQIVVCVTRVIQVEG